MGRSGPARGRLRLCRGTLDGGSRLPGPRLRRYSPEPALGLDPRVDGYGSYKGLARRHPQIQLAFCLAHTIRTQSRFDDRACFGAGGGTAQGDDMLDLQCAVMDDDALDYQLQNGLAFDHARSVQSRSDPFTERGQARQRFLGLNALLV